MNISMPHTLAKTAALFCMAASFQVHAAKFTRLPEFTLQDVDGKAWSSSELNGKACVVDFWATWCNTCKETIPKLAELSSKYKDQGLVVVGISVDKGSSEKIGKAAKKLGINYLVLLDKENSLSKSFGFTGIPSLYVFDGHGNLKTAMPGYDPDQEKQLTVATDQALAEQVAETDKAKVMEKDKEKEKENARLEELALASKAQEGSNKVSHSHDVKTKKTKKKAGT